MNGHVPSVQAALRILMSRARLLGLLGASDDGEGCTQPQTVVLLKNDCRLNCCRVHQ